MDFHKQLFLQGMAAVLKNLVAHQYTLGLTGGGEYHLSPPDVKKLIGSWRKEDFARAELPPGVYEIIEPYL